MPQARAAPTATATGQVDAVIGPSLHAPPREHALRPKAEAVVVRTVLGPLGMVASGVALQGPEVATPLLPLGRPPTLGGTVRRLKQTHRHGAIPAFEGGASA